MMDAATVVVVDVGTQSLRASLVDAEGRILRLVRTPCGADIADGQTVAEVDPDRIWAAMGSLLRQLTSTAEYRSASPVGLVVTDFRDTAVYLDAEMRPIRPSVLWLDSRLARLPGYRNLKLWNKIIFALGGVTATAEANSRRTVAQWLRENEPENWARCAKYVPLGAYLNFKLTGRLVVSTADCAGHFPIVFRTGRWMTTRNARWNVFGLEPDQLCGLVEPGAVIGCLTSVASQLTGLPCGMKVFAGASDKSSEVVGDGCLTSDCCAVSLGKACTVDMPVPKYKDSEMFLPAYRAPFPGLYEMEIQIYRGLWMLRWFGHNFATQSEREEAAKKGVPLETILDRLLSEAPAGSKGLLLQPYWGSGLSRPYSSGSIVGFTEAQDRACLYRSIIEGLAFSLKEGLEKLQRRTHRRAQRLVVSGGGSASLAICQIIADVFDLPVLRTQTGESSTIGAAIGGFLAAGVFTSPARAAAAMIRYSDTLRPDPERVKLYRRSYRIYKKIYPSLKKVERELKGLRDFYERRDQHEFK